MVKLFSSQEKKKSQEFLGSNNQSRDSIKRFALIKVELDLETVSSRLQYCGEIATLRMIEFVNTLPFYRLSCQRLSNKIDRNRIKSAKMQFQAHVSKLSSDWITSMCIKDLQMVMLWGYCSLSSKYWSLRSQILTPLSLELLQVTLSSLKIAILIWPNFHSIDCSTCHSIVKLNQWRRRTTKSRFLTWHGKLEGVPFWFGFDYKKVHPLLMTFWRKLLAKESPSQ